MRRQDIISLANIAYAGTLDDIIKLSLKLNKTNMEKNNTKRELYLMMFALAMLIGTSFSVEWQLLRSLGAIVSFIFAILLAIFANKEKGN